MNDRRRNKSEHYQWTILERSINPFILSDLSSAQGMSYRLQPFSYDEKLLELQDELNARMWEIIEKGLTERQKQVIKLSMQEFTQNEIAKMLGINQTSVHKVVKGNIDYKNGKKRYGGAYKKITKLCAVDPEIQRILKEIAEVCEYTEF